MKRGVILLFILLLISLASAQYIFSVDVEVMPKFISAGDNIIVNTNIKSIGISSDRVDIKISYEIIIRIIKKRKIYIIVYNSI